MEIPKTPTACRIEVVDAQDTAVDLVRIAAQGAALGDVAKGNGVITILPKRQSDERAGANILSAFVLDLQRQYGTRVRITFPTGMRIHDEI